LQQSHKETCHGAKRSVAISADSEEELLEAAVQRAVRVHEDTPELRQQIKTAFKERTQPAEVPPRSA
jgi:predicted small metal-binding protein